MEDVKEPAQVRFALIEEEALGGETGKELRSPEGVNDGNPHLWQ